MFLWCFIRKFFGPTEKEKKFILDNLTLQEMEEIMGPEQVNIARRKMGLPPLPPDHQDENEPKGK